MDTRRGQQVLSARLGGINGKQKTSVATGGYQWQAKDVSGNWRVFALNSQQQWRQLQPSGPYSPPASCHQFLPKTTPTEPQDEAAVLRVISRGRCVKPAK